MFVEEQPDQEMLVNTPITMETEEDHLWIQTKCFEGCPCISHSCPCWDIGADIPAEDDMEIEVPQARLPNLSLLTNPLPIPKVSNNQQIISMMRNLQYALEGFSNDDIDLNEPLPDSQEESEEEDCSDRGHISPVERKEA